MQPLQILHIKKRLKCLQLQVTSFFWIPPYFAVGKYSDFNRYNANKFGDSDQEELAELCTKLSESGVHIILTNSNHPRVHQLYRNFEINVLETRRNISSKSSTRSGQDVLINSRI